MTEKVIDVLKNRDLVIPRILFMNYKDLNITNEELILIIYIVNEKNLIFNAKKIGNDLKLSMGEVLTLINSLSSKDLISLEITTIDGVKEEYIDVNKLYKKLAYFVINEEVDTKQTDTNIFDTFESEFGRTLSPIEYELITGWLDNGFSEELVICALKEAVYNGVSNLRYIDKILFEWKKKGIKNKEDVENDRKKFNRKKSEKVEVFEYDWLNDNE
jgi:DNA replication protein